MKRISTAVGGKLEVKVGKTQTADGGMLIGHSLRSVMCLIVNAVGKNQ